MVFVSRASRLLRDVVPAAARAARPWCSRCTSSAAATRTAVCSGAGGCGAATGSTARAAWWRTARTRARRVASLRARAPISIVHPGVDTAAFAPSAEARERAREKLGVAGRRVLLTVSRLAANKGHARVIEALPALRARFPDLVYLVVGQGGERAALEALAAARGVADAVRFEGLVDERAPTTPRATCSRCRRAARARRGKAGEGFGIAYVEAGACGVPVVASASGGGAEVVIDGETGCVVDPGDPGALERAIAGLLADPARARRLGEAARRHCLRFDWERGTDALEAVLREAAARA